MRQNQPSSIYIAPLRITKGAASDRHGAPLDKSGLATNASSPTTILEVEAMTELAAAAAAPPARFHNYLRALYAFQPAAPHSSSTVTLPLNAGDIVLVHSVHVNGWADGTLLDTGARGWLPTNYCEAYDHPAMRPLLKGLTEFWDIVRCGTEFNLAIFRNQDYMRGLIAGVRALLEKTECLTRDAALVKDQDTIRRTRKALLSDLAMLVRSAKHLQQLVLGPTIHDDLDIRLDDMLLQAFRIVTRAVLFCDAWNEQAGAPLDSPTRLPDPRALALADSTARHASDSPAAGRHKTAASGAGKIAGASSRSTRNSRASMGRTAAVRRHSSTTHRMSYGRAVAEPNSNLISDYLHRSYDEFLTVLASFLGSHMHSRSSSELLLTTQNAVRACRELFAIVETVIERDYSTSRPLVQAKDSMYYAITDLVHAARQVFKPIHALDEDLVYLPDEAHSLVQAATACVSAAGRCVARTKATLEEIGDFEVETIGPHRQTRNSDGAETADPAGADGAAHSLPLRSPRTDASRPIKERPPRISVSQGMSTPPLSFNTAESPSSGFGSVPPTPKDEVMGDLIRSAPLPPQSALSHQGPVSPGFNRSGNSGRTHKSGARPVGDSTSSDGSFERAQRRSDPSNMSTASTRVSGDTLDILNNPLSAQSSRTATSPLLYEDGEAEIMVHTFAQELVISRDGSVVGGTLNALVEKLTAHDSTPDVAFVTTFYLTFRLFARPEEFARALIGRFEYVGATPRIAGPVRLRVYNVLKGWLESHWRHDCDDTAAPLIIGFARETLVPVLPMAGRRILELVEKVSFSQGHAGARVLSAMGKTSTSTATYVDPASPLPPPVISKTQLAALKAWKMGAGTVCILDFDPLELARQITLKTSKIFCSILPEELLGTEWTKRTSSLAVNVRAMSTLSTDISNLVSDSVLQLEEPKKRAVIIKQWVKIAKKCLELHNYDTLLAIICALDSTNIKRMRKTWEAVPQKTKSVLADLCKIGDVAGNYANLRQRFQSHVPPCLPFIGPYLTALTMADSANPSTRPLSTDNGEISVINLEKHIKTAKIISELQAFQIPYRFTEISELQTWMQDQLIRVRSAGEKSFQLHYRRSLVLEPREMNRSPNAEAMQLSKDKDKFDFLNWTHLLQKEKSVPVSS